MSDFIKREDAIEVAYQLRHKPNDDEWNWWLRSFNAIPTIDAVEVVRGEWIDKGWKGDWQFETDGRGNCWYEYECSKCGFRNKGSKSNYCPHCGAKMKGADDEV